MANITSINVYYQVEEVYIINIKLIVDYCHYFSLPPNSLLLHRQDINPVHLVRPVYSTPSNST